MTFARHPLVRYLLQDLEALRPATGLFDLRPLNGRGSVVVWIAQKRRRICKDVDEFGAEETESAMVFHLMGRLMGCQETRFVNRREGLEQEFVFAKEEQRSAEWSGVANMVGSKGCLRSFLRPGRPCQQHLLSHPNFQRRFRI